MYNTVKGHGTNHRETDSTGNGGNRRATYRLPPATRTDLPTFAPTVGKPPTPRPHHGLPSHEYAASVPHANTHLLPRPANKLSKACLQRASSPLRLHPFVMGHDFMKSFVHHRMRTAVILHFLQHPPKTGQTHRQQPVPLSARQGASPHGSTAPVSPRNQQPSANGRNRK